MRYYTEPHTTSKVTVQFHQPYIAVEFFEEMKDQPGVYELKVVGPTVKYWCATREEGVRFCVDFERRWVERHQATAALVAPPAQKLEPALVQPIEKIEPVLSNDEHVDE